MLTGIIFCILQIRDRKEKNIGEQLIMSCRIRLIDFIFETR